MYFQKKNKKGVITALVVGLIAVVLMILFYLKYSMR